MRAGPARRRSRPGRRARRRSPASAMARWERGMLRPARKKRAAKSGRGTSLAHALEAREVAGSEGSRPATPARPARPHPFRRHRPASSCSSEFRRQDHQRLVRPEAAIEQRLRHRIDLLPGLAVGDLQPVARRARGAAPARRDPAPRLPTSRRRRASEFRRVSAGDLDCRTIVPSARRSTLHPGSGSRSA